MQILLLQGCTVFQKPWSNPQNSMSQKGDRASSTFSTQEYQCAIVQNLVFMASWCPEFVHLCNRRRFSMTSGFRLYRMRQKELPDLGGAYLRVGRAFSGGERVVEQRCTCRFQCTPWRGRENTEPLLLRSLYKMAGRR